MELIVLAVVTIIVYLAGAVHGWNLRERYAKRLLGMIAKQVEEQIEQETQNLTHIVIEKHNDTFFVYDKETNRFMAQGTTKDEVEEVLKQRFPEKRFACSEKILHEMGFLP
jgi:hypothetical protein